MKLSDRLQYIMEQIPSHSRMADIGSDHALLPVAAIRSGRAVSAVAGEVNAGPLQAARKQVMDAGLGERIHVRKGDGLAVLRPNEADVITIAGMGGALIANILDSGQEKLAGVQRLVLQPNVGEDILRKWLIRHNWILVNEHILEEDGKVYEILTAVPATSIRTTHADLYKPFTIAGCSVQVDEDLMIRMGPLLLHKVNDVFIRKWQGEIAKLQHVTQQLELAGQEAAQEKKEQLRLLIQQLEEVLACLPRDKP